MTILYAKIIDLWQICWNYFKIYEGSDFLKHVEIIGLGLLCCAIGGEQVSEEEESGVDEDIDQIASAPEDGKLNRRKSDTKNKKTKQTKTLLPRLL